MKRATCNSCNAPVIWAVSAKTGKPIPIDATPVGTLASMSGLFVLVKRLEPTPLAWAVAPDTATLDLYRQRDVALYRTHFVTCPNAARHRNAA